MTFLVETIGYLTSRHIYDKKLRKGTDSAAISQTILDGRTR